MTSLLSRTCIILVLLSSVNHAVAWADNGSEHLTDHERKLTEEICRKYQHCTLPASSEHHSALSKFLTEQAANKRKIRASLKHKDEINELKINHELSAIYSDLQKLNPDDQTPTRAPDLPNEMEEVSTRSDASSIREKFERIQLRRQENKKRIQAILAKPLINRMREERPFDLNELTDPGRRKNVGDFIRKTEDQEIRDTLDPKLQILERNK